MLRSIGWQELMVCGLLLAPPAALVYGIVRFLKRKRKPAAGWLADPSGRHDLRYWDGSTWTATVSDGGQTSTDPME
jgi:hypothetical protein